MPVTKVKPAPPEPARHEPMVCKDAQSCINHAYAWAAAAGRPAYVYGGATVAKPPYTSTDKQPSKFRSHWRVDPDGRLWWYRSAVIDGAACDSVVIKYEEIT